MAVASGPAGPGENFFGRGFDLEIFVSTKFLTPVLLYYWYTCTVAHSVFCLYLKTGQDLFAESERRLPVHCFQSKMEGEVSTLKV